MFGALHFILKISNTLIYINKIVKLHYTNDNIHITQGREKDFMKTSFTIEKKKHHGAFMMEQATKEDTAEILSLLLETAKWFNSNRSTQWEGLLIGVDSHRTDEAILRGDVFISRYAQDVSGMVMLLQKPSEWDVRLWGEMGEQQNDAIYLHRLAINRKYANHNLGNKILTWCKKSIRFEGKTRIRLDCLAGNEFLNNFYRNSGYTYIGEKDGYSLYELCILSES